MKFNCPSCNTQLMAEASMVGQMVKCPSCDTKLQIPEMEEESQGLVGSERTGGPGSREVWTEKDPTNPNAWISFGIGMAATIVWYLIVKFGMDPKGKTHGLFFDHLEASFINTLFFCWAAAICILKLRILKHQRRALLLDVLPVDLGRDITSENVGTFIDHVYNMPVRLRDSLMVNRIRKALEFFEVRQNTADVASLMTSQSGIDGSRIMGSYIMAKAFLWAIPLVGFIGTVVGLSHAISGMSFGNVEDVNKIVGSINNVTSGLGTAFDATLLGLIFAVLLNFPINSLAKHEEETLNDIDAYCNEVLLPRLNDGSAGSARGFGIKIDKERAEDLGVIAAAIGQSITNAQSEFLTDLNQLSTRLLEHADTLDQRNVQYEGAILQQIAEHMGVMDERAQKHQESMLERFSQSLSGLKDSSVQLNDALRKSHEGALGEFTKSVEGVAKDMRSSLEQSLENTRKSVTDFTAHVTKLADNSKDYQQIIKSMQDEVVKQFSDKAGAICTGIETALKSSLELTNRTVSGFAEHVTKLEGSADSLHKSIRSSQEEVVKQFADKAGAIATGIETALKSSLDLTQRTVSSFAEQVQKMGGASDAIQQAMRSSQEQVVKQFSEKTDAIASGIENALKASIDLTQRTVSGFAEQVSKMGGASDAIQQAMRSSQEQVVKQFSEKTDAIASGIESALKSSIDLTQRTVSGFAEQVSKMGGASDAIQQAMRASQEQVVKQLSEKTGAIASGIEASLKSSIDLTQRTVSGFAEQVSKMGGASDSLQQAIRATQENVAEALQSRLASIASSVEGSLQSAMQQTQRTVGELAAQISRVEADSKDFLQRNLTASQENFQRQFGDKITAVASGVENSLNNSLQLTQRAIGSFAEQLGGLTNASREFQQAIQVNREQMVRQVSESVGAVCAGVQNNLNASVQSVNQTLAALDGGIRSLNAALEQVGSRQVQLQAQPSFASAAPVQPAFTPAPAYMAPAPSYAAASPATSPATPAPAPAPLPTAPTPEPQAQAKKGWFNRG